MENRGARPRRDQRAKAREIARCKREQEMEARRIEDEMRAEKFAREQAEKANLVVEQKAARAKKLREEKEAARLKKLKNEEKRSNKEIGSSLEAEIKITASDENFTLLEGLDLAEYFITSKAEKMKSSKKEEIKIEVKKTDGNKCPRCWKISDNKCIRCDEVLSENV